MRQQGFVYEDPDGSSGEEANSEESSQEEGEQELIALISFNSCLTSVERDESMGERSDKEAPPLFRPLVHVTDVT